MPPGNELLPASLMLRLERMELVSRKIFRGRMKGERRSRRKGQSVEFADFRAYVPGDDLRFIDWNLYARLDRLFLKLFLEEEDLHFHALIDNSPSMAFGDPSKLAIAQRIAAAMGFIALCRSDRLRLSALGDLTGGAAAPLRGRHNVRRMVSQLEAIEPRPLKRFRDGIRDFCLRSAGKGIVVLISDLLEKEGFEAGLRDLVARDYDIYVVHVLAEEELRPDFHGDLKLIDSEDADEAEISVSRPLLDRYDQTLRTFLTRARDFCVKRGIGYVLADPRLTVEQLIVTHLAQRGLVR